jgi:hypothetical protein
MAKARRNNNTSRPGLFETQLAYLRQHSLSNSTTVGPVGEPWNYERFPSSLHDWQPGYPIDMPSRSTSLPSEYPSYDTAQHRYWANRAWFELRTRRAGLTSRNPTSTDPISVLHDRELQTIVSAGNSANAPIVPGTNDRYILDHNYVPQRVVGLLTRIGFSGHEARRITRISDPRYLLEVTPRENSFFDDSGNGVSGSNRTPLEQRLTDPATRPWAYTRTSDPRVLRPLGALHDEQITAIINRLNFQNIDLDSSAFPGQDDTRSYRQILTLEIENRPNLSRITNDPPPSSGTPPGSPTGNAPGSPPPGIRSSGLSSPNFDPSTNLSLQRRPGPSQTRQNAIVLRERLNNLTERRMQRTQLFRNTWQTIMRYGDEFMHVREVLQCMDDVLQMHNNGSLLPDAQREAEQMITRGEQLYIEAGEIQEEFWSETFAPLIPQLDEARRNGNFETRQTLSHIKENLREYADLVGNQARNFLGIAQRLRNNASEQRQMISALERAAQTGTGATTAPQARALGMIQTILGVAGATESAARILQQVGERYASLENTSRQLADTTERTENELFDRLLRELAEINPDTNNDPRNSGESAHRPETINENLPNQNRDTNSHPRRNTAINIQPHNTLPPNLAGPAHEITGIVNIPTNEQLSPGGDHIVTPVSNHPVKPPVSIADDGKREQLFSASIQNNRAQQDASTSGNPFRKRDGENDESTNDSHDHSERPPDHNINVRESKFDLDPRKNFQEDHNDLDPQDVPATHEIGDLSHEPVVPQVTFHDNGIADPSNNLEIVSSADRVSFSGNNNRYTSADELASVEHHNEIDPGMNINDHQNSNVHDSYDAGKFETPESVLQFVTDHATGDRVPLWDGVKGWITGPGDLAPDMTVNVQEAQPTNDEVNIPPGSDDNTSGYGFLPD